MKQFVYTLSIRIYYYTLRIAALLGHIKAKSWINGRKESWNLIQEKIEPINDKVIWFHCSSLGEFEQGRPVIEAIKKKYPKHKIALSFFSPSGFEVRKDTDLADLVFYLPLDTPHNATKIIQELNPQLLILVKYEYWFNLIQALHQEKIPIYVISAIFRKEQIFFKPWGAWMKNKLQLISHFFVQDQNSIDLLEQINITAVSLSGDTRYDRVRTVAKEKKELPLIAAFQDSKELLVAGSSWPSDHTMLISYANSLLKKEQKIIIAPHNLTEEDFTLIESKLKVPVIRYSQLIDSAKKPENYQVLILDTMGMLTYVYRYADLVYVGGGFNKGIHNVLEPSVFSVPVIIGPNYQKFLEARELLAKNGLQVVQDQEEFTAQIFRFFTNQENRKIVGGNAGKFIKNHPEATEIILKSISI